MEKCRTKSSHEAGRSILFIKSMIPNWLKKLGLLKVLTSIVLVWTSPISSAAMFTVNPSNSSTGSFQASYSMNSRYYVFLVEVSRDSSSVIVQADSGSPSSGSVTITKPNGTYGYFLRLCDRMTGGFAGNCNTSGIRNVNVNRSSGTSSINIEYSYDALGRLVRVDENSATKRGYCYDDAGNRKAVALGQGGGNPCDSYDAPSIDAPSGISASTHTGGGYTINWNPVSSATRYELRLSNNTFPAVNDPSQTTFYTNNSNEAPVWIRACNEDMCSSRAYF